jgi:hypothetical protein
MFARLNLHRFNLAHIIRIPLDPELQDNPREGRATGPGFYWPIVLASREAVEYLCQMAQLAQIGYSRYRGLL